MTTEQGSLRAREISLHVTTSQPAKGVKNAKMDPWKSRADKGTKNAGPTKGGGGSEGRLSRGGKGAQALAFSHQSGIIYKGENRPPTNYRLRTTN